MNTQNSEPRRRLILFPFPLQGHINPMFQLAKILQSRGFNISIIHTALNSPNPANHPQFTFHRISDGVSESKQADTSDAVLGIRHLFTSCEESFLRCLEEQVSEDHPDGRVSCVISDSMWYFAQGVADKFEVPCVVLCTSSITSWLVTAIIPVLEEKGYYNDMDSKLEDPVDEFPPLKVKDLPIMETSYPQVLLEIVTNMVTNTQKSSGLIFNTFQQLEGYHFAQLKEKFPHPIIFPIGPLNKSYSSASTSLLPQDTSSISWLDKQGTKSVLYVSFGSLVGMDANSFVEVAWGLANSMHPFLWVVRPGSVIGTEWLEWLPEEFWSSVGERCRIVKWAPQQEVLSHPAVGGFWTHAGWNSTMESICEGVAMICTPFYFDQHGNARYISDVWNIGIILEKGLLERGEIEKVITILMVGANGEEMRKKVLSLREKSQLCLRSGGSSDKALDDLVKFISALHSSCK